MRDAAAETDPAPRRSAPAESAPVSAQAEAAGTARRTVEQAGSSDSVEARPAPAEPAEPADPKKTTPPAAPSPDRPDSETAPRGLRESLHQQKVSDWIEARREGSSGAPHPDGDREETHGGLPRRAPRPKIESGHILETLKAAALKTGHGDGAAASIARFLVNPPADGSAGPAGAPVRTAASGSAPAPAATAPPNLVGDLLASPADGSDAIEGAARLLHANGGSGRYQATMHLEPPELGQLRVQVRMHRQAMTLQVQADTQPVARLIESRLSDLREALATHGIRVDRAHVVVRTPDSAEANGQPSHHQSPAGQGDSGNAGVAGDGGADGGAARSADDPPARHEHRSAPDSEANANRLEGDGLEAARGTWHASISERSVDLVA